MDTGSLHHDNSLDSPSAVRLLETMLVIRRAEARLAKTVKEVGLPGPLHISIGQEAIAAGACLELSDRDWITSTHRGHGHFLAKGGDIKEMFAEIWGKESGICRGMGGSMHVADFAKGIMGANGIVGGGLAIATGAGYAAKLDGDGKVAVCFFGDGAANQGVFMESMNMASIWSLPVIFICENNEIAEFTRSAEVTAGTLCERAAVFMPATQCDGNDVIAVHDAVRVALERARSGQGPSFIEAKTYRIHGHVESEGLFIDVTRYRAAEEIEAWAAADRDPIERFLVHIFERSILTREQVTGMEEEIDKRIDEAIAFAEGGADADVDLVYQLLSADKKVMEVAR